MAVKIEKRSFGKTARGENVTLFEIGTPELTACVLDYGATVQALLVMDKNGKPVDVVLGHDTIEGYETHDGYLGACVGRVANRIGGAEFTLNGKMYPLAKNDGQNHLHGGLRGFDKYVWDAEILEDGVKFSRVSPDMEEGYPGNLAVSVTYRVENGAFTITYDAKSDRDTLCNLTNHSYFNLNGGGSALSHVLQINTDQFLENSNQCMPTGKILSVDGTPFDFRAPKPVGQDIGANDQQLQNCGGYDHNFCLPDTGDLYEAAVLSSPKSGITMKTLTTMPGVQLYTANFLGPWEGKGGAMYDKRGAVCLETQFYPNAMRCEGFRKPILKAGETYHQTTVYAFSAN